MYGNLASWYLTSIKDDGTLDFDRVLYSLMADVRVGQVESLF